MPTRRQALTVLGTTGIGTATFHHALAANADGAEAISTKMLAEAERVAGIELAADQHQRTVAIGKRSHEAMRKRLAQLLKEAHDELPPGTHYADWFDETRTVIRTGAGQL